MTLQALSLVLGRVSDPTVEGAHDRVVGWGSGMLAIGVGGGR